MKTFGIANQSVQSVFFALKDKHDVGFLTDKKTVDILITPGVEYYQENSFEFKKNRNKCKIHIIVDFIEQLAQVKQISIVQSINSAIEYLDSEDFDYPSVSLFKDKYLFNVLKTYEETVFQREIQTLIYKGITSKEKRSDIIYSVVYDIFSRLKRDFHPTIVNYQQYIKPKFYDRFINWINSKEARKFSSQLIRKHKGDLLDSFEISYLYTILNKRG